MKKLLKKCTYFFAIGALIFNLAGCKNNDDDDNSGGSPVLPNTASEIPKGYLRVNMEGFGSYYLWAWKDVDPSESAKCTSWSDGGIPFDHSNGGFSCVDIKLADPASVVGLIVKSRDGNTKYSGDSDVMFYFPKKYNQIYFKKGSGTIYLDSSFTKEPVGTTYAIITGNKTITLSCNGVDLKKETVKLTDKNGTLVPIAAYDSENKTLTLSSSLKSSYATSAPYTIEVTDPEGNTDKLSVGVSSSLVENWFGKTAAQSLAGSKLALGITVNGTTASFKTWAPIASSVELLLFNNASELSTPSTEPVKMELDGNGFWTVKDVNVSAYKYYKFRITNNDVEKDVADIWSYIASGDSVASQICDINAASAKPADWEESYVNPFGNSGAETKSYTDAIIYEMHIRDWSRAFAKNSLGKFDDITDALKNSGTFAKHLKDLGITHVQILPMFDYAETNADSNYNWGYNPYHFNVPEGRYTNYGSDKDGTDSVIQLRKMIKAFHDAGIAVNMDVVYNHTSGTGNGSLYDMTVPEYFYRFDSQGNYANGSGCGNEIATNHKMVNFYVIESLKHWMNDYHINGFRFDLMGCLEQSTMQDIYNALYSIDKNVMVYGEPWTGGTSEVKKGADTAVNTSKDGHGVGAFDDDFRDAIKGKEFGGFGTGQVQGKFADEAIIKGLTGASSTRNDTGKPELSLHYVECHDNYTLFDKLAMSYLGLTECKGATDLVTAIGSEGLKTVKAEDKLAAAYIFLSQGTPFINGGQEFLRTKQGNENSYKSNDSINQIDLSMKETYADVYKTYKGLIAFRKANSSVFGKRTDSTADTMKGSDGKAVKGFTKYLPAGESGDFCIYFNATDTDLSIETSGYSKVIDVTSGSPAETTALPSSLAAKSFVILKK